MVDLVVELDHCSRAEAIEQLADRVGLGREPAPQRAMLSASQARRLLERFVSDRGWNIEVADEMGLAVVIDRGGRPRVRFPFRYDTDVVWHQDRIIGPGTPKWLSPAGSRPALYNASALRLAQERGGLWVVEGVSDVLALLCTFEQPAVVGVPGVHNFRPGWVPAFRAAELSQVYLLADNDNAGEGMRRRVGSLLHPAVGSVLQVQVPPAFHDLDEWRRGFAGNDNGFSDALLLAVAEAQAVYDREMRA